MPVCPVCLSGESRLAPLAIHANYQLNWPAILGSQRLPSVLGVIAVERTCLDISRFCKALASP